MVGGPIQGPEFATKFKTFVTVVFLWPVQTPPVHCAFFWYGSITSSPETFS